MLEALWQKNTQTETNPLQYFESIEIVYIFQR